MSFPFLPRSLVTTTSAFEQQTGEEDETAPAGRTFRERKFRRRWSCRGEEDGGGRRTKEERESGDIFIIPGNVLG